MFLMATYNDVDNFFAKYNGKQVDRDGFPKDNPYQCVDFATQYTAELYGVNYLPTPVTGGARDIYEQFSLGAYFTKIPNTADFVPAKGDVVVWGAMPGNYYGHIAVADGVGNVNQFYSYDQNWGVQRVQRVLHNYGNVLGVLRPKGLVNQTNQGDIMDLESAKQLAEAMAGRNPNDQGNINDLQKNHVGGNAVNDIKAWYNSGERRDWLNAQAGVMAGKDKAITDLQAQVKSQQDTIDKLNKQIKDQPVTPPVNNGDSELLDQTGNWLTKLIKRLFGGK